MSSFQCEHCDTEIIDNTIRGRIKGCKHYPVDIDIYMPESDRRRNDRPPSMIPAPFGYEDNSND